MVCAPDARTGTLGRAIEAALGDRALVERARAFASEAGRSASPGELVARCESLVPA